MASYLLHYFNLSRTLPILIWAETPLSQFLVDFDKKEKQLRETQALASTIESFSNTLRRAIIATHFSLIGINEIRIEQQTGGLDKVFGDILSPWIRSRTDIFGFVDGSAMYNMAVYLINEQGELEMKFRDCDNRMVPKNRKWRPGTGHVGICFTRKNTAFAEDATSMETTSPETSRPEDAAYYRSVIAEPIKVGQEVVGVFIVTSSAKMQFNKEIHVPVVQCVAQLLGHQLNKVGVSPYAY